MGDWRPAIRYDLLPTAGKLAPRRHLRTKLQTTVRQYGVDRSAYGSRAAALACALPRMSSAFGKVEGWTQGGNSSSTTLEHTTCSIQCEV